MGKTIWLPKGETRVIVDDGEVKVIDTMIMTEQLIEKNKFGFNEKDKV